MQDALAKVQVSPSAATVLAEDQQELFAQVSAQVMAGGRPGRWSCLMARKTVALLGKSLLGKVRSPATGAEGLPSRCLPLVMSKALSLLQKRAPLSSQLTGLHSAFPGTGAF